jgi:hypothetical protein
MRLTLAVTVAALAGLLVVGANAYRFIGAKPVIRTKQFEFLPAPEVARVLSAGHANTAAKLRWIDSFAWFQWQIDHAEEARMVDGRSAMARLYDTLIALDPLFEPFYLHANLNLSGVMGRRHEALSVLARGTLEIPGSMAVWRNLLSELVVFYDLEQRHPNQMAALLDAWAAAVPIDERAQIWQWRQALVRRKSLGLDQVDYWVARLAETPRGSPYETFLTEAARDAAARLAQSRLEAVLAHAPAGATEAALANPGLLARAFPRGVPPGYPLADGHLLPDPWGHPWRVAGTAAHSVGLALQSQERRLPGWNVAVTEKARLSGRQPADLAEAVDWAGNPALTDGAIFTWDGRSLGIRRPDAVAPAWDPRPR